MKRPRVLAAFALLGLMVLGRGEVVLANSNAYWSAAFNDPMRVDFSDISGLIAKTLFYRDPMDDVRRALLVVLRATGDVTVALRTAFDDVPPRAHRPRAPPAV